MRPGRQALFLAGCLLAEPALAAPPVVPLRDAQTTPVRTAPLAPGERLLEMSALGIATARADQASLTVTVGVEAAERSEARSLYAARIAALRAELQRLGVAASALHVSEEEPPGSLSFDADLHVDFSSAANLAMEQLRGSPPAPAAPLPWLGTIRIDMDAARAPAVRAMLERAAGVRYISGPIYTVSDPAPALRAARLNALATARARAAAQAALDGMRIVRILRVSERRGSELLRVARADGERARRPEIDPLFHSENTADLDVGVMVGVDFALVPQ